MGHNNIIELNGKRYDAITGAYIGKSHTTPVPAVPPTGQAIDGVKRPGPASKVARPTKPASHTHKPTQQSKHESKSSHHKTTHHHKSGDSGKSQPKHRGRSAHHAKPHKPQPAKTLMRSAVQKPAVHKASNQIARKPANSMEFKKAAHAVDRSRLQRSLMTPKHRDIRRFNTTAVSLGAPAIESTSKTPRPVADISPMQTANLQTAKPASTAPTVNQVFENAIARATSHEQPQPKLKPSRRMRAVRAALITVALLALAGGAAWAQRSTIELKVASFQAGFQADQPGHELTSYSRDSISYKSGQVILNYSSGNRHYQIAQQKSDWNSQTLLDTAVLGAASHEPQTIESRGRIVYLYKSDGGSWNAAWVDGGVRFELTGNAYMTPDDIRAIVDSI